MTIDLSGNQDVSIDGLSHNNWNMMIESITSVKRFASSLHFFLIISSAVLNNS